ncbi:LOW QUALITY PROTEIN: uncharacterized protein ACIBXB_020955 [Morphnus guianensis]
MVPRSRLPRKRSRVVFVRGSRVGETQVPPLSPPRPLRPRGLGGRPASPCCAAPGTGLRRGGGSAGPRVGVGGRGDPPQRGDPASHGRGVGSARSGGAASPGKGGGLPPAPWVPPREAASARTPGAPAARGRGAGSGGPPHPPSGRGRRSREAAGPWAEDRRATQGRRRGGGRHPPAGPGVLRAGRFSVPSPPPPRNLPPLPVSLLWGKACAVGVFTLKPIDGSLCLPVTGRLRHKPPALRKGLWRPGTGGGDGAGRGCSWDRVGGTGTAVREHRCALPGCCRNRRCCESSPRDPGRLGLLHPLGTARFPRTRPRVLPARGAGCPREHRSPHTCGSSPGPGAARPPDRRPLRPAPPPGGPASPYGRPPSASRVRPGPPRVPSGTPARFPAAHRSSGCPGCGTPGAAVQGAGPHSPPPKRRGAAERACPARPRDPRAPGPPGPSRRQRPVRRGAPFPEPPPPPPSRHTAAAHGAGVAAGGGSSRR